MKREYKRYNIEFKRTIVDLYNNGSKVSDLSSEYGVDKKQIYRWIQDLKEVAVIDGVSLSNVEFLKLQKELKEVKLENEILKKAVAIFTQK